MLTSHYKMLVTEQTENCVQKLLYELEWWVVANLADSLRHVSNLQ